MQHGPVTGSEIIDVLNIPQGTAYDYVQHLETAGLVEKTRDQCPYEYDAELIALPLSTDGNQTVTPALIAAVVRRDEDEDIDVYLHRTPCLESLAVALEYAYEYVDGTVNLRIAAGNLTSHRLRPRSSFRRWNQALLGTLTRRYDNGQYP